MNIKDIALLKRDSIDSDFLIFQRVKTIRTRKKDNRPIKVPLHEKAKAIIEKCEQANNPFILLYFEPGLKAVTQRNRIHRITQFINDNLKKIAEKFKINTGMVNKLTTYSARHSFATILTQRNFN